MEKPIDLLKRLIEIKDEEVVLTEERTSILESLRLCMFANNFGNKEVAFKLNGKVYVMCATDSSIQMLVESANFIEDE